jgi:hypothetical protein
VISVDDRMIDRYVMEQIRKRGITLYDFLGGSYIDPDPEGTGLPHERARYNRFQQEDWSFRMCELLSEGKFDEFAPYSKLVIPLKDLIRYWWNNIADADAFLDEIMGDLYDHFKDKLLPVEEERVLDASDVLDKILDDKLLAL